MTHRTPVMAGNWKMYKTPSEGAAFIRHSRVTGSLASGHIATSVQPRVLHMGSQELTDRLSSATSGQAAIRTRGRRADRILTHGTSCRR